ncbi:MAG: pre-peptidase C-terminal domain-containing protein [Psychrosphaera sp.]|nr:pre-peptidase C-terminal domain-containing protein [Psychrosphaera sp.]
MSITGDKLKIRLVGANGQPLVQGYKVLVDYITQGFATAQNEEYNKLTGETHLLDTCGTTTNRRDVMCFQNSHPTEFQHAKPVARLITTKNGSTYTCTTWRVGSDNRMFTNNHCASTQGELNNSEIWFNHYNTQCGGNSLATITKITPNNMLKTQEELDYTLYTVNDFDTISGWGYYGLEVREPVVGERIYIPQHGAGRPKELSIESQLTNSGNCEIKNKNMSDYQAGYQCDTTGGSSGSPVLAANTNNVVALHHWGGCKNDGLGRVNRGVQISNIWPNVSQFFNGVPTGPGTGGPYAPVAKFTVTTTALTAVFSNSSTDADGDISSYAWSFGDGTSASKDSPSHTYAQAGSYNVELTVTDAKGLTGTVTNNVTVQSSQGNTLENGQTISGVSGAKGEWRYFKAILPSNAKNIVVNVSGGSGDADLYTQFGSKPTLSNYECRPWKNGNNESCTVANPNSGEYHFGLNGYSSYAGVAISLNYEAGSVGTDLNLTNLSANAKNWLHYTIEVAPGTQNFNATTNGGSGDADLYIRYGTKPSEQNYGCRSTSSSNTEQCKMNNPQAGTWYVSVHAWSAISGLNLKTVTQK